MSLGRGVAFGAGCAALGAAGWAAISVATDMRLGFLAILVGGLAGFGMGIGNKARGGAVAGVLAGCVAALAILASRYTVMHLGVRSYLREASTITAEEAVYEVASDVYQEYYDEGYDLESEEYEGDYPPVVMDEANRRWGALSAEEQQEYLAALGAHYADEGEQAAGLMTAIAFIVDFGLFGFIWVALGVGTAYQIGAAKGDSNAEAGEALPSGDPDGVTSDFWARSAPTTGDAAAPPEAPPERMAA